MNTTGNILIIEDYQNWRERLGRLFANKGYGVQLAKDFEEAKELLRRQVFDFAVVDIRLSERVPDTEHDAIQMEGTLREIQKYGDNTPIVIMSAYATPSLTRDALKRFGAEDFIEKDKFVENREHLLQLAQSSVEKAIEKRSAKSPRLDLGLLGHAHLEYLSKAMAPNLELPVASREMTRFLGELLREMLPLSSEGIRVDVLSTTPRLASLWCWSRSHGHVAVVELRDYSQTTNKLGPVLTKWTVITQRSSSWSALDLSGTVYELTDMSFPEFLEQVKPNLE